MVSITGMMVSLKTEVRFPKPGQQGHGARNIQLRKRFSHLMNIFY